MVHIALVEDDQSCQEQMAGYLDHYAQQSGEEFKLYSFGDGDSINLVVIWIKLLKQN